MIFHENSHEISYLIFFRKLGKMSGNLSSAAVVIDALRVNTFIYYSGSSNIIDIVYLYLTSPMALCCVLEQDTLFSQLGKMTEKIVNSDLKHQLKLTNIYL